MPLVSIITPTQAHNADHLGEVWTSIAAQPLPDGWELEWLVQEDGAEPSLGGTLAGDPRIRYDALGVQIGGPATRNAALGRARGDVVAGMDHDDRYLPGGLTALLRPLIDDATTVWACGRSRLDMEDGTSWTKPDVFPPGHVAPGAVADHFLAADDFPFPAAFTTFRRDQLLAAGGWPAVARSADAVLLADLGDRWPGWWVPQAVAVYRRWSGQRTVQPADIAIRDLPHIRGVIAARRAARRRVGPRAGS